MITDFNKATDSLYTTSLEELFTPAIEYVDQFFTGSYHPYTDIIIASGGNIKNIGDILNNRFGNRNYSDYTGKITDRISVKMQTTDENGNKFYMCTYCKEDKKPTMNDDYIFSAKNLVKSALKDILEPLSELQMTYLRTNPKQISKPWEEFLFASLNDFMAYMKNLTGNSEYSTIKTDAVNLLSAYIEDNAEQYFDFDNMKLGELLCYANEAFEKYADSVPTEFPAEKDKYRKMASLAELLITELLIMPYILKNTNLA